MDNNALYAEIERLKAEVAKLTTLNDEHAPEYAACLDCEATHKAEATRLMGERDEERIRASHATNDKMRAVCERAAALSRERKVGKLLSTVLAERVERICTRGVDNPPCSEQEDRSVRDLIDAEFVARCDAALSRECKAREALTSADAALTILIHHGHTGKIAAENATSIRSSIRSALSTATPEAQGCAECDRLRSVLTRIAKGRDAFTCHNECGMGQVARDALAELGNDAPQTAAPLTPPAHPARETGDEVERIAQVITASVRETTHYLTLNADEATHVAHAILPLIRAAALEDAVKAVEGMVGAFYVRDDAIFRLDAIAAIRACKVKP